MADQVIVIGTGIIGMCAAKYLQRLGAKVTVLDPVAPGKSLLLWQCRCVKLRILRPTGDARHATPSAEMADR
jgi:glycine/D-amino acid oxidase-like deaminating enzyme